MLDLPPEQFTTARLLIRKPRPEDAASIFANYATDPEVTRYLTWTPHTDVEMTRQYVANCMERWENKSAYQYFITRHGEEGVIGALGLFFAGEYKAEVGYVLARAHWGQGIMPEALQPLVDWALAQPAIHRVWAVCDVRNPASARVMEKVGMQYEATLRRWLLRPGSDTPADCLCYAVVASH